MYIVTALLHGGRSTLKLSQPFLHGIILFTIKWCSQVTVTGEKIFFSIISHLIVCSWNLLMLKCLTPEQNGNRITVFTQTTLPMFTILSAGGNQLMEAASLYNYRSMTETGWAILHRILYYPDPMSAPNQKAGLNRFTPTFSSHNW